MHCYCQITIYNGNSFFIRTVHKKRPQSVGEGFFQYGHFSDKEEGILQMRTSAFFGANTSDF